MKKFSLFLFGFLIAATGCSLVKQAGLDDMPERIEGLEAANRELKNQVDFLHGRVQELEKICLPPAPDHFTDIKKKVTVEDHIRAVAREMGYPENTIVALAKCESGLNPNAVGDHGKAHGLYQIWPKYHKDISLADIYDVEASTRWTITQLRAGHQGWWTCWKKIHRHKKHRRHRGP